MFLRLNASQKPSNCFKPLTMSHSQSNYRYHSYSQQKQPNINVTSSSVSNVVNNTINHYNMNNTNTAHIAHIPPNAQYKWQWKCGSKWRDYQAKHSEVSNHRAHVTLIII